MKPGLLDGNSPRAAAVLVDGIRESTVKKAIRDGADLLEVRVDTFKKREKDSLVKALKKLKALNRYARLPIIITVRSVAEGGAVRIPDNERAPIFDSLMGYADIVDIELSSTRIIKAVVNSARRQKKKVIVSHHNFRATPGISELHRIIKRGRAAGADLVKVATTAKGPQDLRRLAGLLTGSGDLIVIAMGKLGTASRVFFPILGSALTYGSTGADTAPGQPTLKVLKKQLTFYGF